MQRICRPGVRAASKSLLVASSRPRIIASQNSFYENKWPPGACERSLVVRFICAGDSLSPMADSWDSPIDDVNKQLKKSLKITEVSKTH